MIRKDLVFVHQELNCSADVITFVAEAADCAGLLNNPEEFTKAVFRRETEISTSIGYEIAIPHGKTDAVKEAFIAYIGLSKPFEWDSQTKDLVSMVFLIGVPEKNTDRLHLKAISEVSKKLINEDFREKLITCQSNEEAFILLDSINQGIEK